MRLVGLSFLAIYQCVFKRDAKILFFCDIVKEMKEKTLF